MSFPDDDHIPGPIAAYFADATEPLTFEAEFRPVTMAGDRRRWMQVPPHRTAVTMRSVRQAAAMYVETISVRCGTCEADFQVRDLMVDAVPAGTFLTHTA